MRRSLWFSGALLLVVGCRTAVGVRPPTQPASGPGGADYAHAAALSERFGSGGDEYWLFQPDDPRPDQAPVVIFLHGWGGTEPRVYGAWIQHIVRKGHIVIYPRYQDRLTTPVTEMTDSTLRAVSAALDRLRSDGPVRPGGDRIAWVGHSLGGNIAASLSANYAANSLPAPAVLMAVEPGGENRLALADLSGMPTDALVLLVVGDADRVVGDGEARAIRAALAHMPDENLELVTLRSENRFGFSFTADHFSPLAVSPGFPPVPAAASDSTSSSTRTAWLAGRRQQRAVDRHSPDALDYFGYWKLLDGLLDAAFRGQNREYALGGTQRQRFMGTYSDGTALTPLAVERGAERD